MTERARACGDLVIAIDGPAASGKSSTAKAVAARLGLRHLDSGAFYRALTLAALEAGIPAEAWDGLRPAQLEKFGIAAHPVAGGYSITLRGTDPGDRLRSAEVNANVAHMATIPAVRDWLLHLLRSAAREGGLVADGRDIGTVVFPDADLKIFLVCAPDVRAARRLQQQGIAAPDPEMIRAEAARLQERDRVDASRPVAPLSRAADAVLVDTTELTFEAQVGAITRLAQSRCALERKA